ncbi:hypothetical protein VZT92_023125 [Zoarces viviparus]|uniref:Uncharacterized protein n=1 Tax=Zoarces viviparus TaxID=48416 RepID=A0AAW1E5J7_ZOAVI
MTSSFRDEAAAVLQSTQQLHSEDKSQLKWPPTFAFNLPLMKSGTFPSGAAQGHGRDLRDRPGDQRGCGNMWLRHWVMDPGMSGAPLACTGSSG